MISEEGGQKSYISCLAEGISVRVMSNSNTPCDFVIEEVVKAYAKVLKCKELNVKSLSE